MVWVKIILVGCLVLMGILLCFMCLLVLLCQRNERIYKKARDAVKHALMHCCDEYDENGRHLGNKCGRCEYWSHENHCCCSFGEKETDAVLEVLYQHFQLKERWGK